mmetsp:Transcript_10402/g.15420  ORF Transcript_10402/g.15420 Transcript_10402/m.15420 type:complete len:242 (-) Transcript_10402:238-963(-)
MSEKITEETSKRICKHMNEDHAHTIHYMAQSILLTSNKKKKGEIKNATMTSISNKEYCIRFVLCNGDLCEMCHETIAFYPTPLVDSKDARTRMIEEHNRVLSPQFSYLLTPVILTTLLTCALLRYAVEILTLETLALHLSNPPSFIYVLLNTYLVNPFFYASVSNFCKMVYISWYFSTVAHALEAFYFAYLCRTKLKLGWMSTLKWFSMVLMVGYFVGWRIKEMVDVQAKEEKKRMEKKAS